MLLSSSSYSLSVFPLALLAGEGSYTHRRLQGQVADGNCYAMGGIAGHAGVFSTAPDMSKFLRYMVTTLEGSTKPAKNFLNATTIELFTTIKNVTQSSRAYGWTTNSFQQSESADHGYDHSCGSMSGDTFMHIGYTGSTARRIYTFTTT
jgi:serine-type D-Ala-D-Ala carboxypeptidase